MGRVVDLKVKGFVGASNAELETEMSNLAYMYKMLGQLDKAGRTWPDHLELSYYGVNRSRKHKRGT